MASKEDEMMLDIFVKRAMDGSLRFPEPLCKVCRDWGAVQICENAKCELFNQKVLPGWAHCEGCNTIMEEYICECLRSELEERKL